MSPDSTRTLYRGLGAAEAIGGVTALVKTAASLHHVTFAVVAGLLAAFLSLILLTLAQIPVPRPARALDLVDDAARREQVRGRTRPGVVPDALNDLDAWQTEVADKGRFDDDPRAVSRLMRVNEWRVEKAQFVHDAEVERVMNRQRPWVLTLALLLLVVVVACMSYLLFKAEPKSPVHLKAGEWNSSSVNS